MAKRPFDGHHRDGQHGPQQKKHKGPYQSQNQNQNHRQPQQQEQHHQSGVSAPELLPLLPPINTDAPFRHASTTDTGRSIASDDVSYEKLEFLGDAYLEIWASKLIHKRFHHLPAGRMSQVRELLVKNETLAVYARAYGFEERIQAADIKGMQTIADKGNKGFNKVMGDVFEAYVAAVCLADEENGEMVAQAWVLSLWEPALKQLEASDRTAVNPTQNDSADPRTTFNPKAKELLQRRIGAKGVQLEYAVDKPMVELKGAQLGQNRHSIALYLTGHGVHKKLLGKGEGRSKVEAGNWAAMEAMYGDTKDLILELEAKVADARQKFKLEKEAKEQAAPMDLLSNLERDLLPS